MADSLRSKLEQTLPPDEAAVCIDSLAGVRLAANSLMCVRGAAEVEAVISEKQDSNTPFGAAFDLQTNVIIVARLALLAAIFWSILSRPSSPVLPILLLLAFLCFDFSRLIHDFKAKLPKKQRSNPLSAKLLVDTSSLVVHLQNAIAHFDSIAQRHMRAMNDMRATRQVRAASVAGSSDNLSLFQQLLGAARRNHPQLRDLVESQAIDALESAGMKAVSYSNQQPQNDIFDVQRDNDKRLIEPLELYPAIVSEKEEKIQVRGRVILPSA